MIESLPLRIAIVGHANTGKTSLLRTLTRDRLFGEVADAAGTTRQVQAAAVTLDAREVLVWYDTPGLEDSIALYDWVAQLTSAGQRLDGPDRIARFLQDTQAKQRFEQEHRVLSQITHSDAVLYVVDTRDPVLAKHRDELHLLQLCAKPVLPVLNFTASDQAQAQPWIEAFARQGIHIYVAFDSVSPPSDGEQLLYETLAQVLAQARPTLDALSQQSRLARQQRREAAIERVAQLCVQVAAMADNVAHETQALAAGQREQQAKVRYLERRCVADLLALYAFAPDDYTAGELPLTDGRWQTDLFSKEAITEAGLSLGKGAAVGAMAGVAVDVLSAGLTLGTGTLLGAAAGSIWQGVDQWGSSVKAKLKGQVTLRVGDDVLQVLAARNLQLVRALEQRGHAAQQRVQVNAKSTTPAEPFDQKLFLKVIAMARLHPDWANNAAPARAQQNTVQALHRCLSTSPLLESVKSVGPK
jgi:GTPase Era involved in 16S rRNA processing